MGLVEKPSVGCIENKKIHFAPIREFDFNIQYAKLDRASHVQGIDMHTHDECEIYVNLTGDVSFMVEDRLYPLTRGDVILVRPGEFHHCVYRSDAQHAMFWILFDGARNAELLELFYGDKRINFISLAEEGKADLIDTCFRLHGSGGDTCEAYTLFFELMELLRRGAADQQQSSESMPRALSDALSYIERRLTEPLRVSEMANALHYSESTIERMFREHLKITPFELIRKKKMVLAASMLRNGETVLDTGLMLGYSDNSHFIKLFKQYYGVTPLQYKKRSESAARQ